MTQEELTAYNMGENLDQIMNLDPRGYGVCRILYQASREYTGEPLSIHCAKALEQTLKPGDLVYLMTGFVLLPFKKAEMDGIVSTLLFARALVKAYQVRPVILCSEDNVKAVEGLSNAVGLHCYHTIEEVKEIPISVAVIPFTTQKEMAEKQADEILSHGTPGAVIAIECPGANKMGEYHNATGLNVTELESKQDILFEKCKAAGILNMAVGDLGNELGMGTIANHIATYIPYAQDGGCQCGCGGGILAKTSADYIVTATCSDWGVYGIIAAIAYLKQDLDIMHTKDLEELAMKTASSCGMIDMYGWLIPAIDGFGISMNRSITNLMREMVKSTLQLTNICKPWFEKVIEKQFFQEVI